jgi:glycerol uptake facilitator protein
MRRGTLFGELLAEFFGTFILILLGDGVVAGVGLAPRLASQGYDWNTIAWGWAFAVVVAVYVAGGVTGAHINPAVTIAMARGERLYHTLSLKLLAHSSARLLFTWFIAKD